MNEEIEVLKGYVESLGLNEKENLTKSDLRELSASLRDADEDSLANYVDQLGTPEALKEFIADTLYG